MAEPSAVVKSADRTLTLLEFLASAERRYTLHELAQDLPIPKSSLHGLLRTLKARGWVSTDGAGQQFGLGVRALQVGTSYVDTDEFVRLSASVLDRMRQRLNETVHLGRLDGDQVVYLAKRDPDHALRLVSAVGVRLPAHATALGKALLAEHTEEEVAAMLPETLARLTPHTLTDRARFIAELRGVRASGLGRDYEESTLGVKCMAVGVGPVSPSQYAISCSVPISRLTGDVENEVVETLRWAQRELGGADPGR